MREIQKGAAADRVPGTNQSAVAVPCPTETHCLAGEMRAGGASVKEAAQLGRAGAGGENEPGEKKLMRRLLESKRDFFAAVTAGCRKIEF